MQLSSPVQKGLAWGQPVGAGMVRVLAGGGAVQGGDGGSWRGRQRWRALAWEAAATGAGVGGSGGRWRGRRRHARGSRERASWIGFPLRGLQTPFQKATTPRVHNLAISFRRHLDSWLV